MADADCVGCRPTGRPAARLVTEPAVRRGRRTTRCTSGRPSPSPARCARADAARPELRQQGRPAVGARCPSGCGPRWRAGQPGATRTGRPARDPRPERDAVAGEDAPAHPGDEDRGCGRRGRRRGRAADRRGPRAGPGAGRGRDDARATPARLQLAVRARGARAAAGAPRSSRPARASAASAPAPRPRAPRAGTAGSEPDDGRVGAAAGHRAGAAAARPRRAIDGSHELATTTAGEFVVLLVELAAGAEQTALHHRPGHPQPRADLLVGAALELAQHEQLLMLRRQSVERTAKIVELLATGQHGIEWRRVDDPAAAAAARARRPRASPPGCGAGGGARRCWRCGRSRTPRA